MSMLMLGVTAAGATPLEADTVKLEFLTTVGVPDSPPELDRVSPVGSDPLATA
jgi:hypothetical protein